MPNERKTTFTEYHHIVRQEGILSCEPIVRGTRTPVRAIVELSRLGYTTDDIRKALPHITPDHVRDALAYYAAHTAEIHEYITKNTVPPDLMHPSVQGL